MENTRVQATPDELTDEQYKNFTIELLNSMHNLKLIKTTYTFVNRLFLNDTEALLNTNPQAREKQKLLADINHYCGNMPIEKLTRIRNICNYIYNAQ